MPLTAPGLAALSVHSLFLSEQLLFFSLTAPAEVLVMSLQQSVLAFSVQQSDFFSFTAPGLALAAAGVALVSVVLVSLLQAARPSIRPAAAMIAKRFMV